MSEVTTDGLDEVTGVPCSECRRLLDSRIEKVYSEVVGWETRRAQGGTNHVALRRQTGRVMCGACMARHQAGVHPGQESLV